MLLKRFFLIICCIAGFVLAYSSQKGVTYTAGSPAGYTNSPFDNKTCTQCHVHDGQPHFRKDLIQTNIPVDGYVAGQTYTITVAIQSATESKFGFTCSPHDLNGILQGSIMITDPIETMIVGDNYVSHRAVGTNAINNQKSWSFDWVAPDSTPYVTFYAAATAGKIYNDSTFTSSATVYDHILGRKCIQSPFSEIYPNPVKDFLNIITNFSNSSGVSVSFYCLSGQYMGTFTTAEKRLKLDMTPFKPGVYLMTIENAVQKETVRIVKL